MFTSEQIITATSLIKNFRAIARHLRRSPQALLVTQKCGDYLVLANAEIFEDLMKFRFEATAAGFANPPDEACSR